MRPRGFGCFTFTALVAGVLTLAVITALWLITGGAMFSPGGLNAQAGATVLGGVQSHATTAGNCAACHVSPFNATTMDARCQACHTDIPGQLTNSHSLHGILTDGKASFSCRDCHLDHRGATASLTSMTITNFPHQLLGYSTQAHQKKADGSSFACADCHPNGVAHFDVQLCATCHQDINTKYMAAHLAAFGSACLTCHDGVDTYGKNFSHQAVAFTLTGKHLSVDCAGCHSGARSIADFKATAQDCFSCHAKDDAHAGQLGTLCGSCHTTNGWRPATFDHSKSAFPLTGAHTSVPCSSCHVNNQFANLSTDCYACHAKNDAHNAQLGTLCGACHSTTAWLPATFDHSKSAFPLTGAHATVPCLSCHVDNQFAGTPTSCIGCHAKDDAHKGQFGTDCAMCHTTTAWLPSTFDHSKTAFPLTGAHVSLKCTQCHANGVFTGTPSDCVACHPEPNYHKGLFGTQCAACHSTSAWSPARFNGAHTFPFSHGGAGSCYDCHPNSLSSWTCYAGCHVHNEAEIISRHQQEGMSNISDCIACHPTGGTGDSGGGGGG